LSGPTPQVTLIAGPTASGKSALALRLARSTGGEIVNADSMQVYADLRVLTARPSVEDEAAAPHHLFGGADAAEAWSVGRWLKAATAALEDIASRGRPAIVVGGTGLYFLALTRGLAEVPPVPHAVRAQVQALYDEIGEAAFRVRLAEIDPAAAGRVGAADRQRLTRAYEVFAASGRPLSAWQSPTNPALAPGSWRAMVLDPPRELVYARCDQRLGEMPAAGVLGEVGRLVGRNLDAKLPAMKALGVAPFAAHLRGEIDLDEAIAQARQDTRRYVKRQITWFRNQAPDWPRVRDPDDIIGDR
jgi:tRNA dimethylallyltransferase